MKAFVAAVQKHTAHKVHHCDSCRRDIVIGHIYYRKFYVHQGHAGAITVHSHCAKSENLLRAHGDYHELEPCPMVTEMSEDDRAAVAAADPETATLCWPPTAEGAA